MQVAILESNGKDMQRALGEAVKPAPRLAFAAAVLCLLGMAVSAELTRVHVFVHTDPDYHSLCAMSEGINCETVAISPYSVFARLPVAIWGLVGYLLMGVLALWAWSKKRLHPAWPFGVLLLLTLFSAMTSALLAFISATRIDSLCVFCMASYAINAGLLALCIIAVKQSNLRPLKLLRRDIDALASRPLLASLLALMGIITITALQVFVPSYWRTPGWADLPKLASGTDDNGRHWIGASDPALTIIEFSDYECPHCRAAHKNMRMLVAKRPTQIRLIHQHLPLDMACHPDIKRPFHKRACLFAEAAECAGLPGRFWEMNDALFSIQETVKTDNVDIMELAVRLGLNRSEFTRCLESHTAAERVNHDISEARTRKLNGTPSFLIGEKLFLGRIPKDEVEKLLPEAP